MDQDQYRGVPPKNYLVESILVTIFCCLPLGIVGIINATKVESLYLSGDLIGAEKAANEAKKWTKIALIVGLAAAVLIIAIYGFGILVMLTSAN